MPRKNVEYFCIWKSFEGNKRKAIVKMGGKKRPGVDAYYGLEADEYARSNWMARNQQKTTRKVLQFLNGHELGGPLSDPFESIRLLDLGCGTGYSSHACLEAGFHVIGLEISRDMVSNSFFVFQRFNIFFFFHGICSCSMVILIGKNPFFTSLRPRFPVLGQCCFNLVSRLLVWPI